MMVTWVKEAWKRLAPEVIIRSFEACGITSSDPDIIHCTKKGKVAEAAREALLCDVGDVDLDATDVILDANRQTPEDSEEDDTSETDDDNEIDVYNTYFPIYAGYTLPALPKYFCAFNKIMLFF